MGKRQRLFSVVYNSTYLILYVVLLALLLITPADAIDRSIKNSQSYNIWLLIFFYVATILVVCFIYIVRLYVNRSVLASIPKSWIPIDLGDVNKHVHGIIGLGLERSAIIAFESRPRVEKGRRAAAKELGISEELQSRIWGGIEHKGWASPESPDLPNLQYTTVLAELPNLIEAKALTLAPFDPMVQSDPPMYDSEAVALLQRPPNLGLRGYIDHLVSLGVLSLDETVSSFLQQYEYARFSTRPISIAKFREIMHLFAQLLRTLGPIDFDVLDGANTADSFGHDGAGDDAIPLSRTPTTSTQASILRPPRSATWSQYRTAPNTPISRRLTAFSTKSSSGSNNTTRHPYLTGNASRSSRSFRSESEHSEGSGSVIRLSTRDDDETLPYVLNISRTGSIG